MKDTSRDLFGRSGGSRKATGLASPPTRAGAPGPPGPPGAPPRSSAPGQVAKRTDTGRRRRLTGPSAGQADLGAALRLVVDRVREFTGAAGAAVGLLDGDAIIIRTASGSAQAHLGLRVPLEGSLSGAALRDGRVVRCDDTSRDARVDGELAWRLRARSLLVVPLYHLNRAVGTLTVLSARARTFDDHDAQTLEVMAQAVSASLGNGAAEDASKRLTRGRNALTALEESEERFRLALEHAPIGMAVVGLDGRWLEVNRALCEILGRPEEQLLTATWEGVTDTEDLPAHRRSMGELLDGKGSVHRVEMRYRHAKGHRVWVNLSAALVRSHSGDPRYFIVQVEDITERRLAQAKLAHQAAHDALTGLPNRALLLDRLRHALDRQLRSDTGVAVMFLDLDRFKVVNDSLGHTAGDELLCRVAERLSAQLRPGDSVSRLGGDEFVVLLEDVDSIGDACDVADRLKAALVKPLSVGEASVVVTASIGIAMARHSGTDADALMRDADTAMYRAKERGKDCYEVFDTGMRTAAVGRLETERMLRSAVEEGRLRIFYQPTIDLDRGTVNGAEALLRIETPSGSVLGPSDFIAVAEESGLIATIGIGVLEAACRQAVDWRKQLGDKAPPRVSVNLSARQLSHMRIAEAVTRALRSSGATADMLALEITETVLMESSPATLAELSHLRELGVSLGVDDFGTGYSSLTYLKRFPLDFVKVDRSFVDGLDYDPGCEAIVSAVIGLGRALGLQTVAEGVENAAQLERLRTLGCSGAQGFYFAEALPAADLTALLRDGVTWPALRPALVAQT
ncbi:MAG TPA: EAL domain-containing protein [Acidimicrobiales bacterium]|nr:EAL domain-containing protein [Acidimicrobiales bacterium]